MGFFPETNYDFPNVSEYDGDLRELLAMYRKVTGDYAFLAQSQDTLNNLYYALDRELTEFKREYNKHVIMFNDHVQTADNKFNSIQEKFDSIDATIIDIINTVTTVNNNLKTMIDGVKEYSDSQNNLLEDTLRKEYKDADNELQEQIDTISLKPVQEVFNPFTGQNTTLQVYINDTYQYLRYGAATVQDWLDAGLTAEELDGIGASAIDWDVNGKALLETVTGTDLDRAVSGINDTLQQMQMYDDSLQTQVDKLKEEHPEPDAWVTKLAEFKQECDQEIADLGDHTDTEIAGLKNTINDMDTEIAKRNCKVETYEVTDQWLNDLPSQIKDWTNIKQIWMEFSVTLDEETYDYYGTSGMVNNHDNRIFLFASQLNYEWSEVYPRNDILIEISKLGATTYEKSGTSYTPNQYNIVTGKITVLKEVI